MVRKYLFISGYILFSLSAVAQSKTGPQVTGYLGYSLLNRSTEDTFATSGPNTYQASVESIYENSPSGGIELRWLNSQSWLFKVGARSMPYRKVASANLLVSVFVPQPLTILVPYSYKYSSLYMTSGYCWDSFYLQLGFSYNFFDFSAPGSTVQFRTQNGTGAIFGFGYKLSDNWSIEYTGYSALMPVESGPNYQTSSKLIFSDAVLSLNYGF